MQFVVLEYDAKDEDVLDRRMSVRDEQLRLAIKNYKNEMFGKRLKYFLKMLRRFV